ncbi:hypothetical protein RUM44_000194 [Polyplax serrata]|uniref:Uncharacterized protein n=1 Tax=Polyplax serrata TaxID=468196 RepID=A0ABR1B582_POLSC
MASAECLRVVTFERGPRCPAKFVQALRISRPEIEIGPVYKFLFHKVENCGGRALPPDTHPVLCSISWRKEDGHQARSLGGYLKFPRARKLLIKTNFIGP